MTVAGLGYVGIANTNPQQALDVIGNVKISAGGIMWPEELQEPTAGTSINRIRRCMSSGTNALYANTILGDQTADLNNINTPVTSLVELPGLNNLIVYNYRKYNRDLYVQSQPAC